MALPPVRPVPDLAVRDRRRTAMKLSADEARAWLAANVHGVMCTVHPERGPDPVPAVYAVSDDGHVGVPIDRIKPKASSRLRREINLQDDPRSALLVEHWDSDDWARLWWVRADLQHVEDPPPSLTDDLGARLARTAPSTTTSPSAGCWCVASWP